MVKISGVNIFPHLVISEIARSITELDPLKGVILQPDPNSIKPYFFQELKKGKLRQETLKPITEEAVNAAREHTGSSDVEFFVVKRGFLPKTSSGKLIARNTNDFLLSLLSRAGAKP